MDTYNEKDDIECEARAGEARYSMAQDYILDSREQDESVKYCDSCSEYKVTKFTHEVCQECHDYDASQCDICNARSLK